MLQLELMSGQDFEIEIRFCNVGKRRNSISDEGNLMRKSMEQWGKKATGKRCGDSGERGVEDVQRS